MSHHHRANGPVTTPRTDRVEVRWTSGRTETFMRIPADQTVPLVEGTG